MERTIRNLLAIAVATATMVGAVASAASTPLPTEFTSGGVLWGDLDDETGFYNEANVCGVPGGDGFAMGDAELLSTGQSDAFDDAGLVTVDGVSYVVPGGFDGPVDLTGETLTAPPAATGPLTVAVEWQGAGPNTIRELVTLTNPGATSVTTTVVVKTDLGSDSDDTTLQASSTGDISGYPTNARWFVTSDSDTTPDDPVIVSVVAGPGGVATSAVLNECPEEEEQAVDESAAKATEAGDVPEGDLPGDTVDDGTVTASGTELETDEFLATYNVTVPAGETRYLMLFWGLYETNAEGIAAGPTWNTNPAIGSPPLAGVAQATNASLTASAAGGVSALAGLTQAQLSQILNWNFAAPAPVSVQPRFTG